VVQGALYSAILTAFIIESMKLLEEDPEETTRDILYTISQQLANSSIPAFPRVKYETPQYAVVVNGLFFTSLSCSIIAALLAVLALQWVANYDMGLDTSSARKRALQRHIRWKGIEGWKMGEIIASLPLLIFISLFLFFIGIADWLWHLNRAISAIVIGGIGIGCLLYSITNVISIVKLEAPFRTPISKGLAPLLRQALVWIRLFVVEFPSEILNGDEEWAKIRWSRIREVWNGAYSRITAPPGNFAKCEDLAVGEEEEETAVESLIWLANSIEITPASRDSLLALTKEVIQFPGELLLTNERINQAPWEHIFIELLAPYLKNPPHQRRDEDMKIIQHLCQAISMISSGINSPILLAFFNSIEELNEPIILAIQLSSYRHFNLQTSLLYALTTVSRSTKGIKETSIHFLFLTIRHEWPKLATLQEDLLDVFAQMGDRRKDKDNDPYPIPLKSLRVLLDIISHQDQNQCGIESTNAVEPIDPIDRYVSAIRRMKEGDRKSLGERLHLYIQRELLFHISRINFSVPSATDDFAIILDLLVKISSCKILALSNQDRFEFIEMLVKMHNNTGAISPTLKELLLNGLQCLYVQDDQPLNRWTNLVLAIDDYIENQMNGTVEYEKIIRIMFKNPPERKIYTPEVSLRDRLIRIKDPNLALWLMEYCPEDWNFEAVMHPDFEKWGAWVSPGVSTALSQPTRIKPDPRHVNFLHAMIIDGTGVSRQTVISLLEAGYAFIEARYIFSVPSTTVIGFIYLASKPL
jgi:hypothetical protein